MSSIGELKQEKFSIEGANNALVNALNGWIVNLDLSEEDAAISRSYLEGMINDMTSARLRNINDKIKELEND